MASLAFFVRARRFATAGCAICAIFFVVAGLAKLYDPAEFVITLRRWGFRPPLLQTLFAISIPLVEFGLGLAWLLNIARRTVTWSMLLLVIGFTVAYCIAAKSAQQSCGCLGALGQYVPFAESFGVVLGRNIALAVCILAFILSGGQGVRRPGFKGGSANRTSSVMGFTLVETVVTVALLSILLALLIPKIAVVRTIARETRTAATIRSHAVVMQMYSDDFRSSFPYLTNPLATKSILRSDVAGVTLSCRYFDIAYLWHYGLADGYYSGSFDQSLFGSRNPANVLAGNAAMLYPSSFVARPEYWNLRTRVSEPSQLAATQQSDVQWPTAKAICTESLIGVESSMVYSGPCVAFVDGHVVAVRKTQGNADGPALGGGRRYLTYSSLADFQARFLYTNDGVRGRDLP